MLELDQKEKLDLGLIFGFIVLFVVDILDVTSSLLGYNAGLSEVNFTGIPEWFIRTLGDTPGLIILKALSLLIIGTTIAYVAYTRPLFDDRVTLVALILVNVIGIFVLGNNYALIH